MQTVSEEFKKHVHEVLSKRGWSEEDIVQLIEVAGLCSLSAANLAERLKESLGEEEARNLLVAILTESKHLWAARARLRRNIGARFYLPDLVFHLRGMLVALNGDARMNSPLQPLADELIANPRPMREIRLPRHL